MNKYFRFNIIVVFGFICFLLSCNSDSGNANTTSSDTPASSNTVTAEAPAEQSQKPKALSGTLDILRATRSSFTGLPNSTKLVFTHSFGDDGKVHLNGWVLVGNSFPGTTVAVENASPSNETFDASTYFSNVILMPRDFNKIKTALLGDNNLQYVLFLPKKVNTNFVGYDIYVSITGGFNASGLTATAEANPSPPRTTD